MKNGQSFRGLPSPLSILLVKYYILKFSYSVVSLILLIRFNIAADLVDQAKDAGELGLAGILVWMRFMATRQLIWNKNYNVKPR